MEDRRGVAQQPVRVDLKRVERAVAARGEQPGVQDRVPGAGHHPPLAAELAFDRRAPSARSPAPAARTPRASRAWPARTGTRCPGRGPGRARCRRSARTALIAPLPAVMPARPDSMRANGHLVAPVEALLVGRAVGGGEAHLPADVADARRPRRAPRGAAARPAPSRELASAKASTSALDADATAFSAATLPPRSSSITRSAPASRARSAVASVQPSQATTMSKRLARVVERQRVRDPARRSVLLVVGGDGERHGGKRRRARPDRPHGAPRSELRQAKQQRVARVRVDEQGQRRPRRRSRRVPWRGDYGRSRPSYRAMCCAAIASHE